MSDPSLLSKLQAVQADMLQHHLRGMEPPCTVVPAMLGRHTAAFRIEALGRTKAVVISRQRWARMTFEEVLRLAHLALADLHHEHRQEAGKA